MVRRPGNLIRIFGSLFGGLVNLAKAPINGVVSVINSVLERINGISVTIPDWVPGMGGKTLGFRLPTIPMLAAGGIVTAPTILEAGEGGEPEAILPISKLAALLDGLSGRDRGSGLLPPDTGGGTDAPVRREPAEPGGEGPERPAPSWPEAPEGNRPPPPSPPPPPGPPPDRGESVVFAPVFHFHGNAGKAEVKEAVRLSFEEFKKLYRQLQDEERRKNFRKK